jgi:hypothetical protein
VENIEEIIKENKKRLTELYSPYDPIKGIGSPIPRTELNYSYNNEQQSWMCPNEMIESTPLIKGLLEAKSIEILSQKYSLIKEELHKWIFDERIKFDFEFWAYVNAKIQDKDTKQIIPFLLNRAQRILLERLEAMRRAGKSIRAILLKARQWGGSTLVQIYMSWIQLVHKTNWHSAIVADVEDQTRNIRGMYNRLIDNYPIKLTFAPFQGSSKNKIISERGNIVGIGSMQKPENLRSFDFAMLHLSEVASWKETLGKKPEDLVQSTLVPTVPNVPYSLIVMESTAKGVGTFFHKEWVSAEEGRSGFDPVFIPWFAIERYQEEIKNYKKFISTFTPYHEFLWESGATLEGINWYFNYKKEYNYDDWRMQSEFPTNSKEAFNSTGKRVFPPLYVQNIRKGCRSPLYIGDIFPNGIRGESALKNIEFQRYNNGNACVWALPDSSVKVSNRYVVTLDIGGKREGADWSVIKVIDRYWMIDGGNPETVFTWRGHLDADLVVWKGIQVAKFYNDALFCPEDNSIERKESTEGDHFLTVIDEIKEVYDNIYCRTPIERVIEGVPAQYGFWTGTKNKGMIIDNFIACCRELEFTERDSRVCDEMDQYELKANGTFGAVDGAHDDLVMATAIGLWLAISCMERPIEIIQKTTKTKRPPRIEEII